MQSTATTTAEYLNALPEERKEAVKKLRNTIKKNLPKGFKETIAYGMITYVVPHTIYPEGYHCNPQHALPFISIASQKNYVVLHHMGIYGSKKLLDWFTEEYKKTVDGKLDMGKGCIRFKKPEQIPFELIGELAKKISIEDWISMYENAKKK